MPIVMGLDQHRAQITAEWINTDTRHAHPERAVADEVERQGTVVIRAFAVFRLKPGRAFPPAMAHSSEDRRAPGPPDIEATIVAERLRAEMHTAVHSLHERLPGAFPRWERRRTDA